MSNSLTRTVLALGMALAPMTAYADIAGGRFIQGSGPAPAAGAAAPKKAASKKVVAAPRAVGPHEHPHTQAGYEALLQDLKGRVDTLQGNYDSLRGDLGAVNDTLDSLMRNTEQLTDTQLGLVDQIDTIVGRLEVYDRSHSEMEQHLNDPVMGYMRDVFVSGLQELNRAKAYETRECTAVLNAYTAVAELEKTIVVQRATLGKDRETVAVQIAALDKDQNLDAHARVQRAEALRQGLEDRESVLAAREQNARGLSQQLPDAKALCDEAKAEYDALARELPARIERNVFGAERDVRPLWLELGLQAAYRGAAAGAVVGAITYRGENVTVGIGGGVGYGRAVVNTENLAQPAQSQPEGEYREESSMTRTDTTKDRYRGHARLRVGTPWDSSQRWVPEVSGVVDLIVRDRDVAVAQTNTSELFDADGERVGRHQVSCGTGSNDACPESGSSRSYGVAPGLALGLWRDGNRDGYAVGVRGTLQVDVNQSELNATLDILTRF